MMPARITQATLDLVEDLEWIAKTGGTMQEAVDRTGRATDTLEKVLVRAGRQDVLHRLRKARPGWQAYLPEGHPAAAVRPGRYKSKRSRVAA